MKYAYTIKTSSDGIIGVYTSRNEVIKKLREMTTFMDFELSFGDEEAIQKESWHTIDGMDFTIDFEQHYVNT